MKACVSDLVAKNTFRIATAVLSLGLVATVPLRAERLPAELQESHKVAPVTPGQTGVQLHARTPEQVGMEELLNALSPHTNAPTNSADSERGVLATGTELLLDGGFEGGFYGGSQMGTSGVSGPWTWTNSPSWLTPIWTDPPTYTGAPIPKTGAWCVYFNPFGPSTARLYQTVSIPAGATTLSFWLKVLTFETTHAVAYDTLKVRIANTSGTPLGEMTYSNLDANPSWTKHNFDISEYAGATVRLQFDTHEDSTGETIFLIDDVSILASASNASCIEDASTMCLVNGRYRVTSHWKNQYAGGAVANLSKAKLTDTTGAFWTADANTYEYLIRFNTATSNGRAWVAITTFTDVEFWVAVTDTVNGQYKEYHSVPGNRTLIYDPSYFVYP
ncbi:MAG: immune inhibitor A [Thermoanaerobaculia bacterium]|nr:immune inhibitor A [Thermoanaerobaculia bacterium]